MIELVTRPGSCSECGLVVGDRVIDVGSEWRTFSNDKGGEDR